MSGRNNSSYYFVDRHVDEGRGENIAIECGDAKITYRELSKKIRAARTGFCKIGIQNGERVLIALPDTPEFFISFLGLLSSGAVPVPINTLLTAAEYEYLVADSGAVAAIVHGSLVEKFKGLALRLIIVGEAIPPQISFSSFFNDYRLEAGAGSGAAGDGIFWYYSSGSTGSPKACVHREQDMIINAEKYGRDALGITEKDKCLSVGKLFFTYGLGNSLYGPLAAGATAVLMPDAPKPEIVLDVIERHQPTLFFSVPSHYARLLDYIEQMDRPAFFPSIRAFTSAGEQLPVALFERFRKTFGAEMLDTIGATECFVFIANRPSVVRPGSTGQLIPGCEAKILDEHGGAVPDGVIGNLFIKSGSAFQEYWHKPEKTKQALAEGWFRTGDRFSRDADGYFWYAGRSDDMIKCNGAWVNPLEVEHVLLEYRAVREAAVVGENDENGLMNPLAYVVLREGFPDSPETKSEILVSLEARLPNYKRPRRIEIVGELPRTATGKLQRFKLRQPVA